MAKKQDDHAPFVLGLVGGILSAIFTILYFVSAINIRQTFGMIFGIIGMIATGFIIYGTTLLKKEGKEDQGSWMMIIGSIIALIPGVLIGPVISLIGGILYRKR